MKLVLWIYFLAVSIVSCRSQFEFGRAAFQKEEDRNLVMEDALRELMVAYGDMSMSMSLSWSFSYGYEDSDERSDHDLGSNSDGDNGGSGGSSSDSPTPAPITSSPVTTLTLAPTTTPTTYSPSPTTVAPSTITNTSPTSSPSFFATADGDAVSSSLPSCLGFEFRDLQAPLFVETDRDSISFSLLESMLEDEMRDRLPFCENLGPGRMLEDGLDTDYYIGIVDLAKEESDETCTPVIATNNCFVAELTVRLFGNATDAVIEHILAVVRELLVDTDKVGEALGAEKSLTLRPPNNMTESDAGQGPQASTSSKYIMSPVTKTVLITVGSIAFVVLTMVVYCRYGRGSHDEYEEYLTEGINCEAEDWA